jgi:VIT1/CCC1 family predicted Fe2+/Mn2+ transporter
MIGEIAAIVAGVNAATSAIKQVAETTNDIQSISGFLSTLGGAEVELARSQNSGKLSEADAVKAALAKKQIQETMQTVKDLFTVSGNAQLYQDAMQAMAEARKAKQAELAAKMAAKKQFRRDMRQLAAVFLAVAILVPTVLALLLSAITR